MQISGSALKVLYYYSIEERKRKKLRCKSYYISTGRDR